MYAQVIMVDFCDLKSWQFIYHTEILNIHVYKTQYTCIQNQTKSCLYRQHRHWVSTSHLWRRSRSWLPRHRRLLAGETGSKHLPLVRLRVRCRKRWSSHCSSQTRRQKLFLGPMLRLQLNCILSENIITNNNYTFIWSKRRSVFKQKSNRTKYT